MGSDTNRAVQLQKMTRGLKFLVQANEGWYYQCSEKMVTMQLIWAFVFHICKKQVFSPKTSFFRELLVQTSP